MHFGNFACPPCEDRNSTEKNINSDAKQSGKQIEIKPIIFVKNFINIWTLKSMSVWAGHFSAAEKDKQLNENWKSGSPFRLEPWFSWFTRMKRIKAKRLLNMGNIFRSVFFLCLYRSFNHVNQGSDKQSNRSPLKTPDFVSAQSIRQKHV